MGWRQWLGRGEHKEASSTLAQEARPSLGAHELSMALTSACQEGDVDKARELLAAGALAGGGKGQSAWALAAQRAPEVFLEVAKTADPEPDVMGPLVVAARMGRLDWVEVLAPRQWSEEKGLALQAAAMAASVECVKALLGEAPRFKVEQVMFWALASGEPACVAGMIQATGSEQGPVDAWAQTAMGGSMSARERMKKAWFTGRPNQAFGRRGSIEMLRALVDAAPGRAMPEALSRLAMGRHGLEPQDVEEAAALLATPATLTALKALPGKDSCPVAMALRKGDAKMASMLTRLGVELSLDRQLLSQAMAGGDSECVAWALEVERGWPEGLAQRCEEALSLAPSRVDPRMEEVAREMARCCDPSKVAQAALAAVAAGNGVLVKAFLPLCDMEELGPLALGALGAGHGPEFAGLTRALARSMAYRQGLDQAALGAPCLSSKPARL